MAQAIRDTLPYFLGAVSANELGKQHELNELRREARLLERQLELKVSWEEAAETRASALLAEARQVGLVGVDVRHTILTETFSLLRGSMHATSLTTSEPADFEAELNELFAERESLRRLYTETKERLDETKLFGSDSDQYENELFEQSQRLKALHLFPDGTEGHVRCPLCETVVESASAKLS